MSLDQWPPRPTPSGSDGGLQRAFLDLYEGDPWLFQSYDSSPCWPEIDDLRSRDLIRVLEQTVLVVARLRKDVQRLQSEIQRLTPP